MHYSTSKILRLVAARTAITAARLVSYLPPNRMHQLVHSISRGTRRATFSEAGTAREQICRFSRRCAGQGCVQRSVAVVILCRLYGSAPNWRIGFGIEPFTAHAWIEVDGRPVGEPEVVAYYFVSHSVDVA
ncbi:lasso peptide biosynthesis B2 protein [Mycetocola spongiae]|uniref:lasso peptide biosynthesis B2 protein n=1 Tax=Mycetocola spongiae TaxID=2859226 RepID=UPI001CF49886|nr:lasso peptide biosynthesis B2 protein [Mycetocola spongiae]